MKYLFQVLANLKYIYLLLIITTIHFSCGSTKKVAYFQGIPDFYIDSISDIRTNAQLKIKPNDNLFISVSAVSKEAASIFNLLDPESPVTPTSLSIKSFLVDNNGCINFPTIGTVKIAGLTKEEAVVFLQDKISEYIIDPVVNIRLLNFNISVLGEVARPGNYMAIGEVITLPQALSMAGDMTIYGVRENVIVAREVDGNRIFARVNMNSDEIFTSPYFYLEQNDIIYVQPNKVRAGVSGYSQNLPLGLSVMSTLITVLVLIFK